jgi:hypothetical protein
MPHSANLSNSIATSPAGSGRGQAGADATFVPAAVTRYGKTAIIGAAAITCLCGEACSVSDQAVPGILRRRGCSSGISVSDGHGMILIERRVDLEDTTYRVFWVGLGPLTDCGL